MKQTTASAARQNWFRLLDEVIEGETILIERHGQRLVLKRDETPRTSSKAPIPDYSSVIRMEHADEADTWGWTWTGKRGETDVL